MNQGEASKLLASYFDSWYSALVGYAYHATGRLPLAEDLVQSVFLRLYRELRQGTRIEQPRGWMFCVLRNEITKQHRAECRSTSLAGDKLDQEFAVMPQEEVEPEVEAGDVKRLFTVLTTREQEVVLLRLASLKYREIAEQLEISPSTVNALLARAIRKLRRAATAEHRGDSIHADMVRHIPTALQ